jgi:hypothetical protein
MKCEARGCVNSTSEGRFVGPFCMPCAEAMRTGRAVHGTAWLFQAMQLLSEAGNYLRPGEWDDDAYKDFSRRFASFVNRAAE